MTLVITEVLRQSLETTRPQDAQIATTVNTTRLERSLPKAAGVLADAEDDVTAYAVFLGITGARSGPPIR